MKEQERCLDNDSSHTGPPTSHLSPLVLCYYHPSQPLEEQQQQLDRMAAATTARTTMTGGGGGRSKVVVDYSLGILLLGVVVVVVVCATATSAATTTAFGEVPHQQQQQQQIDPWWFPTVFSSTSSTTTTSTTRRRLEKKNRIGSSHNRKHHTTTSSSSSDIVLVVGILSQPGYNSQNHYIAASYVKWIEAGGARSIPIPYDASPALIDDLFLQINGLLLPGGAADMPSGLYYLLDKIVQSNLMDGIYFPVWGTCLGFEFLIQYMGGPTALQNGFEAENVSWPLYLVQSQYELYNHPHITNIVVNDNVTMNSHHQGIEPIAFLSNINLTNVWHITSVNYDTTGRPFVSTIEPKDPHTFPIYGVQYHPEKNAFEYALFPHTNIPYENINHSPNAIEFSMYLAQFFIHRVRYGAQLQQQLQQQQSSKQQSQHEYTKPDIYPLITTYPIQTGLHFEEIYLIPTASHWNNDTTGTAAVMN